MLYSETKNELDRLNGFYLQDEALNSIGLYTGIAGQCLLMAQNYLISKDPVFLERCYSHLDLLCKHIESDKDIICSFASGIAGCGWIIQYLADNDIIDSDTDSILDEIDEVLYSRIKYLLEIGDSDLLNGALGIGTYLIKRKKNKYVEVLINFLNSTKISENNEIKWVKEGQTDSFRSYDLGLAHGSAGIIHFLLLCYKSNILKETCKELIDGSVSFLLNNIQDFNEIGCFFPSIIAVEEYNSKINKPSFSRLSWCYGDLGIWYTLYRVSILFSNLELQKNAVAALIKTSERIDFEQTHVIDAGFCHGSSGIAYIYHKLWINTKNAAFKESANFWLRKTLDFNKDLPGTESYQFLIGNFDGRSFQKYDALLEGSSGVAIVYLNFLYPKFSQWDDCMMLS